MLEALARHALLDLEVEARGDLHVDGHHTVEDTGIVLGQALAKALGDRSGIRRYGHALVPARRGAGPRGGGCLGPAVPSLCTSRFPRWQMLGDYDVFLTPEFFRALVQHAGLTVHLDLIRGENPHHIVEATFKAVARALVGDAVTRDPRVRGVPSTKGAL